MLDKYPRVFDALNINTPKLNMDLALMPRLNSVLSVEIRFIEFQPIPLKECFMRLEAETPDHFAMA